RASTTRSMWRARTRERRSRSRVREPRLARTRERRSRSRVREPRLARTRERRSRSRVNHTRPARVSDSAGSGLDAVEWTFDPWRDQRGIALLAVGGVLALWAVIWTFQVPLAIGVTLGIYSAWQLLPAVAPAECRVGPSGASLRRLLIMTE